MKSAFINLGWLILWALKWTFAYLLIAGVLQLIGNQIFRLMVASRMMFSAMCTAYFDERTKFEKQCPQYPQVTNNIYQPKETPDQVN